MNRLYVATAAAFLASTSAMAQIETRVVTFENEGAILHSFLNYSKVHLYIYQIFLILRAFL